MDKKQILRYLRRNHGQKARMSSQTKLPMQLRLVQVAHHAGLEVPDYPRIEKVVRPLLKLSPGRLLEVGYSRGGFADHLVNAGWECTGLDINERQHSKIKIIECDLNEGFPVEKESFDVIAAGEIIEHMIDEGSFLRECHRTLRPSGLLALTTPNLSFLPNRFIVFIGGVPKFVYEPYHYHFHTKTTLTNLLETQGFVVERIVASHVLYSRRRHWTGLIFELLADWFPTFGAHLIVFARRIP
jgi:2-polyprenyl-3-methyl-5-hydroxy-6-metoxy-1,4-benzoquinol methylase